MCWLQLQGHVPLDQISLQLREYSSECLQTNHHFTCKPLQFVCVQSNYNQFFSAAHSLQVISPSVSIFLQPEESPSAGHYKQSQLSGTSHQLYFSNQVAVAIFHLQTLIYDYVIQFSLLLDSTCMDIIGAHNALCTKSHGIHIYMIRNSKTLKKG